MKTMRGAACIALLVVARLAAGQTAPARACTGLTLIDGTARQAIPNATILVRDDNVVRLASISNVRRIADVNIANKVAH